VAKAEGTDTAGSFAGAFIYKVNPRARVVGLLGGAVGSRLGLADLSPFFFQVFGGVRVLTPGGGGAFLVGPFYEHSSFPNDGGSLASFAITIDISILF
jgi:hypothetical protein